MEIFALLSPLLCPVIPRVIFGRRNEMPRPVIRDPNFRSVLIAKLCTTIRANCVRWCVAVLPPRHKRSAVEVANAAMKYGFHFAFQKSKFVG